MFVHCNNSPTSFTEDSAVQRCPDLSFVSQSLKENSSPRHYPPVSLGCSTSASPTPPLDDLQYFRSLCWGLNKEDLRSSIPEWEYWSAEAQFFAERVKGDEAERQNIQNSDYWKAEAQFWKARCMSPDPFASRYELANLDYWKYESCFWKSIYERKEGTSPSSIRHEINSAPYWRSEYRHLSDTFQTFTEPYEPSRHTASPPPLSSLPPPTACLVSDITPIAEPEPSQVHSVSRRETPSPHCADPPVAKLRWSTRLQVKETGITQTAGIAAAIGRTKPSKARENKTNSNKAGVSKVRLKKGRQNGRREGLSTLAK